MVPGILPVVRLPVGTLGTRGTLEHEAGVHAVRPLGPERRRHGAGVGVAAAAAPPRAVSVFLHPFVPSALAAPSRGDLVRHERRHPEPLRELLQRGRDLPKQLLPLRQLPASELRSSQRGDGIHC